MSADELSKKDVSTMLMSLAHTVEELQRTMGREPLKAAPHPTRVPPETDALLREIASLRAENDLLRKSLAEAAAHSPAERGAMLRARAASAVSVPQVEPGHEMEDLLGIPQSKQLSKAAYSLVVCTDREKCEFVRPGRRGIRVTQKVSQRAFRCRRR